MGPKREIQALHWILNPSSIHDINLDMTLKMELPVLVSEIVIVTQSPQQMLPGVTPISKQYAGTIINEKRINMADNLIELMKILSKMI